MKNFWAKLRKYLSLLQAQSSFATVRYTLPLIWACIRITCLFWFTRLSMLFDGHGSLFRFLLNPILFLPQDWIIPSAGLFLKFEIQPSTCPLALSPSSRYVCDSPPVVPCALIVFLSLEITALPSSALATLLMCGKRRDVWLGVRHVTPGKSLVFK